MRAWVSATTTALGMCTLLWVGMAVAQGAPGAQPTAPSGSAAEPIPALPAPGTTASPPAEDPSANRKPADRPPAPPATTVQPPPTTAAPVGWPALPPPHPPEADKPAAPSKPWTTRDLSRDFWQVGLGVRTSWVKDAGFDPFATTDTLTHGSLFATRTLLVMSNASLAAGLSFESGGRTAAARGQPTSLTAIRPGAVVEGRYHLDRDLYVGLRLVPQAIYTSLKMEEPSSPAQLVQTDWRFGLDTTAQVGWNFLRMMGVGPMAPEYWLLAECGYGFTQRKDVVLKPDIDSNDPRSKEALGLGQMGMSGVMMRVAFAVTF